MQLFLARRDFLPFSLPTSDPATEPAERLEDVSLDDEDVVLEDEELLVVAFLFVPGVRT